MVLFLTFNLSQTHMNRVFGKQLLLHTKPGTAGVGHMRRQAQQFHVKSAGVGAFHLRLSRMGRQTSPIAQKTLFVPVSKAPVINALKGCPNISPPVREQRLLAFSASSQYYHRFNSESPAILVYNTLKQKRWQLLPQKYRETERRNFPFSGSNSSRLSLVVQQELFAKDPESMDNKFERPKSSKGSPIKCTWSMEFSTFVYREMQKYLSV